jgi:signal transduction histidine kinase
VFKKLFSSYGRSPGDISGLDLINDILDQSKVEAGRFETESVVFDPYGVIQEVVKVLGIKAREKGTKLHYRAEGKVPQTIHSDPARLRQIMTNLIGNAVGFTEQGGVAVQVRAAQDNGAIDFEIEVADSGVGMPADALDKIFDPFVQADSSVTRKFGGTGLGLSISRKFARAGWRHHRRERIRQRQPVPRASGRGAGRGGGVDRRRTGDCRTGRGRR